MNSQAPNLPAIFIASHDALKYRDLLVDVLGNDISIGLASSKEEVVSNYSEQPVVLGRPDFLVNLLETRPPVRWVQSTWAGVNLLVSLEFRDYQLSSVKEIFGHQMAEYALGFMLAHEIKLLKRHTSQREHAWDTSLSGTLQGKVLGVMGTGSIGGHIARVATNFAMEPIGYNTSGKCVDPFTRVYTKASLSEFLKECDYLIGVLPDLPETTSLLNERSLNCMKDSACLINVGRGNLIDDEALCTALAENRLAGAVLDVFREEPLPADSPLWDVPNLSITGHVAAESHAVDIARLFIENYQRYSGGQNLLHLVDFNKGY